MHWYSGCSPDSITFRLNLWMRQHLKTTCAAWRMSPSFLGCSSLWSRLPRSSNRLWVENREDCILTSKEEQRKRGDFFFFPAAPWWQRHHSKSIERRFLLWVWPGPQIKVCSACCFQKGRAEWILGPLITFRFPPASVLIIVALGSASSVNTCILTRDNR